MYMIASLNRSRVLYLSLSLSLSLSRSLSLSLLSLSRACTLCTPPAHLSQAFRHRSPATQDVQGTHSQQVCIPCPI